MSSNTHSKASTSHDVPIPGVRVFTYNYSPFMGGCRPPPLPGIHVFNYPTDANLYELYTFLSKFGKIVAASARSHCSNIECCDRFQTFFFENERSDELADGASDSELEMGGNILHIMRRDYGCGPNIPTEDVDEYYSHASRAGTLEEYQVKDDDLFTSEWNCSINDLNEDCLRQIFSYFGMKEKIKLELVCKRWRIVLLNQWKTFTHLDFENQHRIGKLNNCMLHRILQRCGMSLQKLELPSSCHSRKGWNIKMISSLCENLMHLRTSVSKLTMSDAHSLTLNCKNLKSLYLGSSRNSADGVFGLLFEMLQLESVGFSVDEKNCKYLSKLPQTVKHLELKEIYSDVSNVKGGLYQAKNLKSLKLVKCHPLAFSGLESLPSRHIIEELNLSNPMTSNDSIRVIDLDYISEFVNLRKLCLEKNVFINDSHLKLISRSCRNLEVLDVSGCNGRPGNSDNPVTIGVTDIGIKAIIQRVPIRSINMSLLCGVTIESFTALADFGKIRRIICKFSHEITNADFSRLISSSADLEFLDVSYSRSVNDELIHMAEKIMILRPNRRLHLIMTKSQLHGKEIPVTNKCLKVDVQENTEDNIHRRRYF